MDVPVNETSAPFTKPVDRVVGEAIESWEQTRPPQTRFPDRKIGQLVDLLFAFRGARIGEKYLNGVLIPMLCRKAGSTQHYARITPTS